MHVDFGLDMPTRLTLTGPVMVDATQRALSKFSRRRRNLKKRRVSMRQLRSRRKEHEGQFGGY
jgi:hypothetical protein